MIVRLKERGDFNNTHKILCFNSMIVRLKELRDLHCHV